MKQRVAYDSSRNKKINSHSNRNKQVNKVKNVKTDMNKGAIQVLEEKYAPDEITTTIQEDIQKFYKDELKEQLMTDIDSISEDELKENLEYINNISIEFLDIQSKEVQETLVDQNIWSNPEKIYEAHEPEMQEIRRRKKEEIEVRRSEEKELEEKRLENKKRKNKLRNKRYKFNKRVNNILEKTFTDTKYKELNRSVIKKLFGLQDEKVHSINECFEDKNIKIEKWRIGQIEKKFIKALEKAGIEVPNKEERENAKIRAILDQTFPHKKYKEQNINVIQKLYGLNGEEVLTIKKCANHSDIKMEIWRVKATQKKFIKALEKAKIEVPNT